MNRQMEMNGTPPNWREITVGIIGVLWLVAGTLWWAWDRILEVVR